MNREDTTDQGCRNLRWALALLDGLMSGGMRRLVLSPGSRSTPLVLAGQRQPELELTPILDERSAAFFALGLALASGRPVGLLCTSGSALAHWFPAVIEASESGIPLILLSADRPPELRDWGANQTIDQTRLFGNFVREFHDPGAAEEGPAALKTIRALGARAAAVSQGNWPGPVHLNLPFREPLVPAGDCEAAPAPTPSLWPSRHLWLPRSSVGASADAPASSQLCSELPRSHSEAIWNEGQNTGIPDLASLLLGRGLICCGPGACPPAFADALWACAERLAVPVLCDPLSGLRFGPGSRHRITRYDSLLRNPCAAAALKPDWVLRFGRAPVSKILHSWLADIPTILVDPGQGWSDPTQDVRLRIRADAASVCRWLATSESDPPGGSPASPDWLARWTTAERQLERLVADALAQSPWCEPHLLADLLAALPEGDGLFCANSMPIRQLDTWSGSRATALRVFGNRGASGIDGQSSTLAGLNASGIPTTGLLGDLSFLHDLSGLLLLRQLDRPCIVLNNGGGRIFDYLPQQGLPGFERLWRTPVDLPLGELLRPFGIAHRTVSDGAGFRQALAETLGGEGSGAGVIEVCLDGEISRAVHQGFWNSLLDRAEPRPARYA
ncbi:2-succinyl-5-enolpyruvyl-6-hydroxy-3-cyclohexene-1-carboxylic-acid synthase [Thiocystis minor]|uniref:2-succinyl-5-enolpyruvyl-6-hydroxy-3- cyclohexene-1-carboxylic-acid synthase n=1 Tax=Thiocystis minor TaxID=61597 RepID=UPI0019139AAD|nr:2-succinyl-5-enolpyruvyl-6-hydroxy-3-cyclohexene-1-carboxylic-acid synthase [Thiocystis minor]MBK5966039.1 2-succinyl-5-enolpyruvyl-6-hydroxy-3-cyclohexene-1-carboxylic-acid synthase [Thiocystis minor]